MGTQPTSYSNTRTQASNGFDKVWTQMMNKYQEAVAAVDDPKKAKQIEMELKQLEQIFKSIDSMINSLLNGETTMAGAPRG